MLIVPFDIPPVVVFSMASLKVAIVGASGETGQSIVEGLLSSSDPKFVGHNMPLTLFTCC